jgi:hypothetical protein
MYLSVQDAIDRHRALFIHVIGSVDESLVFVFSVETYRDALRISVRSTYPHYRFFFFFFISDRVTYFLYYVRNPVGYMDANTPHVHEVTDPRRRRRPRRRRQQQRKLCHGNRKDQRFRRKCRLRGMSQEQIEKSLKRRNKMHRRSNRLNSHARNTSDFERETAHTLTESTEARLPVPMTTTSFHPRHKRKRDDVSSLNTDDHSIIPKSISSISMVQPTSKRTKEHVSEMPVVAMDEDRIRGRSYRYVRLSRD